MIQKSDEIKAKIDKTTEDELVLTILELAAQLTKNGNTITEAVKLTTQQWLIMLYICKDPNIPFLDKKSTDEHLYASDIAEALNVSKPNITNLIISLTGKGYIKQTENPNDRRHKFLEITQEGKEVIEKMEIERNKANQNLFAKLDMDERKKMLEYLRHCLKVLKRIS